MAEERTLTSRDDDELLDEEGSLDDMKAEAWTPSPSASTLPPRTDDEADAVADARAQIEETRSQMTDTIDAIKNRLSPATLMEEAKEATIAKAQDAVSTVVDAVKEKASTVTEAIGDAYHNVADHVTDAAHHAAEAISGAAHSASEHFQDFKDEHTAKPPLTGPSRYDLTTIPSSKTANIGATIVETIKLNPVPAAIAGFGLGWLIWSAQRHQTKAAPSSTTEAGANPDGTYVTPAAAYQTNFGTATNNLTPTDPPGLRDRAADLAQNLGGRASDFASGISDRASDFASGVSDRASDLKSKASDWAGGVRDNASQFRDKAGDAVHNYAVQTKQQAGAATDAVGTFIQEQPLAAAAIALLLGAAVAYSLPSTQKENELLGPQRDRLVDQGKDAAHTVADRVQSVANVALGQAQQSLSQTVGQAKEQFKQTVQQTRDTVVSEAQHQGLTPAGVS